jgi:hypothetical protein
MRLFVPCRELGLFLVAVAFAWLAAPADASYILTFSGPVTASQECELSASGNRCDAGPTGNVQYAFLFDNARLGERSIRTGLGEVVTMPAGSYYAEFLGRPVFEDVGPIESRVTTEEHYQLGQDLHDLREVRAILPDGSYFETLSLHDLIGLPPVGFSVGSRFAGHQLELTHGAGAVSERTRQIDSVLTLTDIQLPEPTVFVDMAVGLVAVVCISLLGRPLRPFAVGRPVRPASGSRASIS